MTMENDLPLGEINRVTTYPLPTRSYSYKIADVRELNDQEEIIDLNQIKPGDLFIYRFESYTSHIGYIHSVVYDENGNTSVDNILIIESSFWSNNELNLLYPYNNVTKTNKLSHYSPNGAKPENWIIVRLRK